MWVMWKVFKAKVHIHTGGGPPEVSLNYGNTDLRLIQPEPEYKSLDISESAGPYLIDMQVRDVRARHLETVHLQNTVSSRPRGNRREKTRDK